MKKTLAYAEKYFLKEILKWFQNNKRLLPWRDIRDPYKIWVSEVILQQTRVDQGLPYYNRFIKNFPDIRTLAKARQEEILRLWQGLGYYSRARNMQKCAQKIIEVYQGIFPNQYEHLISLPGIGPYTAAAVSSIAADEPRAVIDGNVYRVLSRVFGIDEPINSSAGKALFNEKASKLMSVLIQIKESPGAYNQAIMEFGALHCKPKNPLCNHCPLSKSCFAKARSIQGELPFKIPLSPKRNRFFNYLILMKSTKIWLRKRRTNDIWKEMFDFILIETTTPPILSSIRKKFSELTGMNLTINHFKTVKHILTHQQILANFYVSVVRQGFSKNLYPEGKFITWAEAEKLPKPIFIDRILTELKKSGTNNLSVDR